MVTVLAWIVIMLKIIPMVVMPFNFGEKRYPLSPELWFGRIIGGSVTIWLMLELIKLSK